jgi:hypothetical protein
MATDNLSAEKRIFKGFGQRSPHVIPEIKLLIKVVRDQKEGVWINRCFICNKEIPDKSRVRPWRKIKNQVCFFCESCFQSHIGQIETAPNAKCLSKQTLNFLKYKYKIAMKRQITHGDNSVKLITFDEVLEIWLRQKGKCALSGQRMETNKIIGKNLSGASLDRIDSNLGYIPGNIQWTCWQANRLKTNFRQSDFVRLCADIATKNKPVKAKRLPPTAASQLSLFSQK